MRLVPRTALHLLLAWCALLAPFGSALHATEHALNALASGQAEKYAPGLASCEQCLAFCGIDGASPIAPPAHVLPEGGAVLASPAAPATVRGANFHAYRSRAPPQAV